MKIVIDVKTCEDCPCCSVEEFELRDVFRYASQVQVCTEMEAEEGAETEYRSVEDENGEVTGVPNWCPHLLRE